MPPAPWHIQAFLVQTWGPSSLSLSQQPARIQQITLYTSISDTGVFWVPENYLNWRSWAAFTQWVLPCWCLTKLLQFQTGSVSKSYPAFCENPARMSQNMFVNYCWLQIKENECLGLEAGLLFSVLSQWHRQNKDSWNAKVLVGTASSFV